MMIRILNGLVFAFLWRMYKKKAVLVIEDNHDLRVCLRQTLEDACYHVETATNGKDGMALLESGLTPSIIILDLNMPIMSGEEFLNKMGSHDYSKSIPTLLVTGDYDKAKLHPEHKCLLKPVMGDVLIKALNSSQLSEDDFQMPKHMSSA